MSNNKKRSRFAKSAESTPIAPEFDAYSDDYMAPVDQLVNSGSAVPPPKVHLADTSKKSKPSLETLMDESREKSMAIPISSNNIGFKMLKKFGYAEGDGLGKESNGIVDPIAVQKRNNTDVSGLGVLEKRERVQKTLASIKKQNLAKRDQLLTDFLSYKVNQQKAARSLGDMKKAQKVIYELDEQAGISVHELTASLHERYTTFSASRPLADATQEKSVRVDRGSVDHTIHGYDRYSGTDVIDSALEDDVPSHSTYTTTVTHVDTGAEVATEPSLEDCLCYLREVHYYCYYCGAGYNDTEDLFSSCPGQLEDDH